MFPTVSKCPWCRSFYWVDQAKPSTKRYPFWAVWQGFRGNARLTETDYLDAIDAQFAKAEDELLFLRIQAWRRGSDRSRREIVNGLKHKDESTHASRAIANKRALLELLSNNSPDELLMKAELMRQLGRMDEALELLSSDFPEEKQEVVAQMREWIAIGNRKVQLFKFKADELPDPALRAAEGHRKLEVEKLRIAAKNQAAEIVRNRAIQRGMATTENVDAVIMNLDLATFREIAGDYPELFRAWFRHQPIQTKKAWWKW